MSLQEQIEQTITDLVDKRLEEIGLNVREPFVLMDYIAEKTNKEARWIRDNWCTKRFQNLDLVKKIGGSWHFKHPEFLAYIHDVWWEEQK